MARTETLANLRLRAQQAANMVNSNLVTTAEWTTLANAVYPELYELLIAAGTNISEKTVNLTVGTDITSGAATLPTDFLGIRLVSRQLNLTQYVDLVEAMIREISRFLVTSTFATHYRLSSNTLTFLPQPTASGQIYRLIYTPVPTLLVGDSDTVDGISGWEEFVVLGMAIGALEKIESDATPLIARQDKMRERIRQMVTLRNLSEARRVVDTAGIGWYPDGASWYPNRGVR